MGGLTAGSRWRLRDGTRLDRVAELPDETKERLSSGAGEDDEAIAPDAGVLSRVGGRTSPVLVDPAAADLLEQFGDGKSVAQAVLDLARAQDLDAHELLEASLPAVERLVRKGYLIDADAPPSALGYRIGDMLRGAEGDAEGGWRIVRVMSRLEDSEVHLVRREVCETATWGVLKLSTPDRRAGHPDHESEILRHAAGVAPELLDEGAEEVDGADGAGGAAGVRHPWIVLEFVPGVPIHHQARSLRLSSTTDPADVKKRLVRLGVAAARTFAELHSLGVAHGDVHPDNLLVLGADDRPRVRLIDLGCARRLDDGRDVAPRPGIDNYREPEVAAALRAGRRPPAASPVGEQYALAVVLFQVVTGHVYLDASADRRELLRQVEEDPPRSFEEVGVGPWPEMERVLRRALSKDPSGRYESMDALADALEADDGEPPQTSPTPKQTRESLQKASAITLRQAAPGGTWWAPGGERRQPTSIFFGSAGLAWGLLHASVRRGDSVMLAHADLWANRALRDAATDEAADATAEADPVSDHEGLPRRSTATLHGIAGVHETAACVAWARGDLRNFLRHARALLQSSVEGGDEQDQDVDLDVDLALGRPGSLVSAGHLLVRARPPHPDGSQPYGSQPEDGGRRKDRFGLATLAGDLRSYGDELLAGLWRRLDERSEICRDDAWLGMAHGWSGALYASLVWCRAAGRRLPERLEARLDELASDAVPYGRGLRWSRQRRGRSPAPGVGRDSMPGWCHGSAGYVLLFDTAARHPSLSRFREVAEAAAWDVWDRFVTSRGSSRPSSRSPASHLCCGLVGQAFSLLVHARETGDESWIRRARSMAESAARHTVFDRPSEAHPEYFVGALFKGEGSLPALLADLERPEEAVWPWLEDVEP